MRTGNAQVARKGALRAWGARVLLAQLRIRATNLNSIKVGEEMRLAQNSLNAHRWIPGKFQNVPEYSNRKFANYMSFEMHPRNDLSLAKSE